MCDAGKPVSDGCFYPPATRLKDAQRRVLKAAIPCRLVSRQRSPFPLAEGELIWLRAEGMRDGIAPVLPAFQRETHLGDRCALPGYSCHKTGKPRYVG